MIAELGRVKVGRKDKFNSILSCEPDAYMNSRLIVYKDLMPRLLIL